MASFKDSFYWNTEVDLWLCTQCPDPPHYIVRKDNDTWPNYIQKIIRHCQKLNHVRIYDINAKNISEIVASQLGVDVKHLPMPKPLSDWPTDKVLYGRTVRSSCYQTKCCQSIGCNRVFFNKAKRKAIRAAMKHTVDAHNVVVSDKDDVVIVNGVYISDGHYLKVDPGYSTQRIDSPSLLKSFVLSSMITAKTDDVEQTTLLNSVAPLAQTDRDANKYVQSLINLAEERNLLAYVPSPNRGFKKLCCDWVKSKCMYVDQVKMPGSLLDVPELNLHAKVETLRFVIKDSLKSTKGPTVLANVLCVLMNLSVLDENGMEQGLKTAVGELKVEKSLANITKVVECLCELRFCPYTELDKVFVGLLFGTLLCRDGFDGGELVVRVRGFSSEMNSIVFLLRLQTVCNVLELKVCKRYVEMVRCCDM